MPAQAGIYLRLHYIDKANLDSGPGSSPGQALRRNDERKSRLLVDEFRILRLKAEDHSLCYFFQNSSLNSFSYSATLRNMSAGT